MSKGKIWVGISGVTGYEVHASTNLKGLCELTGVSYGTAKSRRGDGGFMVVSGKDLGELRSWWFAEVDLVKIGGRGSKGGFKI